MIGGFQVGPYQLAYQQGVVTGVPHGVVVRRGKIILWPDWAEEQRELDRVEKEIKSLEKERDVLLAELQNARSQTSLYEDRLKLAKEIAKEKRTYQVLLSNLSVERKEAKAALVRLDRMREEVVKIVDEEDNEDLQMISFILGELDD